ncbi:MAG: DNA mismatch repair endonuclease MutL [Clostridia bacterium]|nr:DNA mismatch repair endonuclease MutL [Clostridia bacterium]
MKNEINILDSNVVDKIAAGEVVERPASAIKELIENSIDAKATAITIEIKNGGKKLMRVSDNGIGIPKSEVKKAFIRHATSKIATEDDLNGILSLGFRGEALASICAVSNVEMITKVQDDITGKRFVIEGGEVKADEEVGAPDGTTIIINDLFYNVPARKKFLKSDTTESTEIAEIINKLALAHSEISFKFINNGKVLLHTDGQGMLKNAIFNVYGRELVKEIIDIDEYINEVSVKGFIGRPVIQRATRVYENFFVNGRYIKSSVLSEAVEEAYYGYVMKGKFPFCCLEINIEPELIDINVHPAKTEIRFKDEELIYETVKNIVKEKIESLDNTIVVNLKSQEEITKEQRIEKDNIKEEYKKAKEAFEIENTNLKSDAKIDEEPEAYLSESYEDYTDKAEFESLEEVEDIKENTAKDLVKEIFTQANFLDGTINSGTYNEEVVEETYKKYENETLNTLPLRNYKIIGQLFNTYFLLEEGDNFYLIDQHAAEEKVLYERLKKDYENKSINTQLLLEPIIYNAMPKEKEVIDKNIETIRMFGFDIEEFGDNSYRIKEVPYIFERVLTEDMFKEILDELLDKKMAKDIKAFDDMFATISCKAAIKAHDKQSIMEGKKLIEDLMSLENPFNCPHGRPVIITISRYELEKKFKRIV